MLYISYLYSVKKKMKPITRKFLLVSVRPHVSYPANMTCVFRVLLWNYNKIYKTQQDAI